MILRMASEIKTGNVTDLNNFVNAVIDEPSFDKIMSYIEKARNSEDAEIIAGGMGDKSKGYFIEPTVIMAKDPHFVTMEEEIFGPVMTIFVYEDDKFEETLKLCDVMESSWRSQGAITIDPQQPQLPPPAILRGRSMHYTLKHGH